MRRRRERCGTRVRRVVSRRQVLSNRRGRRAGLRKTGVVVQKDDDVGFSFRDQTVAPRGHAEVVVGPQRPSRAHLPEGRVGRHVEDEHFVEALSRRKRTVQFGRPVVADHAQRERGSSTHVTVSSSANVAIHRGVRVVPMQVLCSRGGRRLVEHGRQAAAISLGSATGTRRPRRPPSRICAGPVGQSVATTGVPTASASIRVVGSPSPRRQDESSALLQERCGLGDHSGEGHVRGDAELTDPSLEFGEQRAATEHDQPYGTGAPEHGEGVDRGDRVLSAVRRPHQTITGTSAVGAQPRMIERLACRGEQSGIDDRVREHDDALGPSAEDRLQVLGDAVRDRDDRRRVRIRPFDEPSHDVARPTFRRGQCVRRRAVHGR